MGSNNAFVGVLAGISNTAGEFNTAIGAFADVLPGDSFNPINATAIGARAAVTEANSLVLGSINGATADTKVGIGTTAPTARLHVVGISGFIGNVGIGTTAPQARLHVMANGGNTFLGDLGCGSGLGGIGFHPNFSTCPNNYALLGGDGNTYINRPLGGTIIFREANNFSDTPVT